MVAGILWKIQQANFNFFYMNNLARVFSVVSLLALSFGQFSCQAKPGEDENKSSIRTENPPTDHLVSSEPSNNQSKKGEKIIKITTAEFKALVFDFENDTEWKYKGELPAIVDFYADWCAPCRMIAPILEELQKEYKGKIQIYKVDVDKEVELAQVFQTQSIPSILFIPSAGQPQMAKGALPKETFVQAINDVLKVTK